MSVSAVSVVAQARSVLDASDWAFSPPPLILSVCQVPGSIGLGLIAGRRGFTSHKRVTLSICLSVCLCQKWKPLDIPGTRLHSATQLFNQIQPEFKEVSLENLCVEIGACLSSGPGENDREHGMGWIWKTVRTSGKLLGQP